MGCSCNHAIPEHRFIGNIVYCEFCPCQGVMQVVRDGEGAGAGGDRDL